MHERAGQICPATNSHSKVTGWFGVIGVVQKPVAEEAWPIPPEWEGITSHTSPSLEPIRSTVGGIGEGVVHHRRNACDGERGHVSGSEY